MARSYYSTIFEQPAGAVWTVIRDFNNYPVWVDGAGESTIEAGKSGDSVGAVRDVLYNGVRRRQKLLATCQHRRQPVAMLHPGIGRLEHLRVRPQAMQDLAEKPLTGIRASAFGQVLRTGWRLFGRQFRFATRTPGTPSSIVRRFPSS